MTTKQQDKAEAIEFLRKHCTPGTRVYTTVAHVARSGMSRSIKVCVVDKADNEIMDISCWVGRAIDCARDHKNGGVKISGCGMDMGFEIVYLLGRVLFHNDTGDGGYALRHNWI